MILYAILGLAQAAEGTTGIGAEMASLREWESRHAAVQARLDATEDPVIRERLESAAAVLAALEAREPKVARGRLRDLTNAAADRHANIRQEASRAANLGLHLPQVSDPDGWYARLPHLAPPDGSLVLTSIDLGPLSDRVDTPARVVDTFSEQAKVAGWAADDSSPPLKAVVTNLYGAQHDDLAGWAIDVDWTVGRATCTTRGVALGPMVLDTAQTLLRGAFGNLLGRSDLASALEGEPDALADDPKVREVALGKLCLFRRKHQDWTPMPVDLGGQLLPMAGGTFVCLTGPEGMVAASPSGHGSVTVVEGGTTVAEVSHAESAGQSRITAADSARFDKLVKRGRVVEVTLDGGP